MDISVSQEQGRVPVTIMSVKGEINAETADDFLAAVQKAYADGACDLLLDLSQVPYISSWGIRAMSDVYSMLRGSDSGGSTGVGSRALHVKLLNPTVQVQKVLATSGLDMYLETFTDRKQAIASF